MEGVRVLERGTGGGRGYPFCLGPYPIGYACWARDPFADLAEMVDRRGRVAEGVRRTGHRTRRTS